MPQDFGWPVQAGASADSPPDDANTENFFVKRVEPHFGHSVPSHFEERTSSSESTPHFSQ